MGDQNESKKNKRWYENSLGIIALLVFFFPAGLFCMWRYSTWNKVVKWIVTGIFALFALISVFSNKNQITEHTPLASTTDITPTSYPTPTPKQPQSIEGKIKGQLGDGESMSIEDAINLDTNQTIPGEKQVDITLDAGNNQWDLNMTKDLVWARVAKLTQGIFPLDKTIYALQVTANIPTTDPYGRTQQTELALITIVRDTYNKIQWSDFDYHNIPTIADTYFENKAVKE